MHDSDMSYFDYKVFQYRSAIEGRACVMIVSCIVAVAIILAVCATM